MTPLNPQSQASSIPALASVTLLPPKSFSAQFWDSGFVKAGGTWVLEDGRLLAEPVQTSTITCVREIHHCFLAMAGVVLGNLLYSDLEPLEIERWDAHEIVTKPNDAICARSTIRLNRDSESVTELYSAFKTAACTKFGVPVGDEHRKIVDGLDVARQMRNLHR